MSVNPFDIKTVVLAKQAQHVALIHFPIALFIAVVVPLTLGGVSEAWFGYHDQRARLNDLLDAEARLAALKIQDFIEGIRDQLAWTVQLPLSENTGDRHRLDALGLLRQAPAVISLGLVDAAGKERLFV